MIESESRRSRPSLHDFATWVVVAGAKLHARRYAEGTDDSFYEEHFQVRHLEQFERDIRARLRREQVLGALDNLEPGSVILDTGCGIGHMIRSVDSSMNRIGLDLSESSLALARAQDPSVQFRRASAYDIPLSTGSVDAAICLEVLEHLPDDVAGIRELGRVIKPGGYLVVSVPHNFYFRSYLGLMGHHRHYTSRSLNELLGLGGFEVIRRLKEYPLVNRVHLYFYVPVRAAAIMVSFATGKQTSPYGLRFAWAYRPIYTFLEPFFRWLQQFDDGNEDGSRASTFLLCHRVAGASEVEDWAIANTTTLE